MRTTLTTTALTAGLLLALTGCSSDTTTADKPSTATTAAPTPEQPAKDDTSALETAVRAYSAAYFKPDPDTAYKMLSARCQGEMDAEIFAAIVKGSATDYGRQDIKSLTVDQQSGDLARVTYTYDVPKLNQKAQPWAREGGQWRYDAC